MESWSLEWSAPDLVEMEKIGAQQRKKETKLCIAQLVERKCQEQEAATQRNAAEVAAAVEMTETTTMPTKEFKEG